MSRADATDGRGRKKGRGGGEAEEVSQEETGWLDDLRSAKQAKDPFDDSDFTDGGSSRWNKLSALSDDAAPARPGAGREAEPAARRRGEDDTAARRRAEEPPGRRRADDEPAAGRRRAEEEPAGRRREMDDPAGRRRAEEPAGRRRADDEPTGGHRRAAEEPTGGLRRAPEEPTGGLRRAPEEPTGGLRRASEEPAGRRRADEETTGGHRRAEEPPGRRRADEVPSRRHGEEESGGRRRAEEPPAGRRAARDEPEDPRRGRPEPPPMPVVEPPVGRGRPEPAPLRKPGGEPPVVRRRELDNPRGPVDVPRSGNAPLVDGMRGRGPAAPPGMPGSPVVRPPAGMPGSPAVRPPVRPEPQRAAFPATPVAPERPNRGGVPVPPAGPPVHGGPVPPGPNQGPGGPGAPMGGPLGPGPHPGPGHKPAGPGGPGGLGGPGGPGMGPDGRRGERPPGRPDPSRDPIAVRPPDPNAVLPPPGDRSGRAGIAAGVDAIRGARSEVRKQLREQQRLRMWTLIALVVLVVGALPFYFVLRAATRDPVLTTLDALDVPSWAVVSGKTVDNISGSRWCLMECRYRERSMESEREPKETAQAYESALTSAGWVRWDVPSCELTSGGDGEYSCWRRDEFTLDLWVRPITTPDCNPLLRNRPTVGPTDEAAADPSASPAAEQGQAEGNCTGSAVTIKVLNTVADERLQHTGEPAGPGGTGDGETTTESPAPTPSAS
ncbi:hypothetical protein [Catellatospora sp. NPDC049609]|uniref:hypothetical protein n=1 Tax=Catellatospora sp. NPDC049609 TaxID=3155505 RepID=UPI00342D24B2